MIYAILLANKNNIRESGYYHNGFCILPVFGWWRPSIIKPQFIQKDPLEILIEGIPGITLVDNINRINKLKKIPADFFLNIEAYAIGTI